MKLKSRWDQLLLRAFVVLLIPSVVAAVNPVSMRATRLLIVITLLLGLLNAAVHLARLAKKKRRVIYPASLCLVLLIVWGITGNRTVDVQHLRYSYMLRLASFKDVKYVWGGESHIGIDCSGLARAALWEAMIKEGIRTANPRLLGPMLWKFWWQDISARAMGEETYGYTKIIGHTQKLAGYDNTGLKVGDLAIVAGTHVLIYCGEDFWIEASPEDQKVVINKAAADSKRAWFNAQTVMFVRWWVLEDG